ncbi:MAG: hypothetical protein UT42_C0007G0003 [Candidatus Falkowbacteria bacterium GW2011_GWA2_39_24]|uniref:Type II secretion system protein GspF domain-containing protein n=1 Tax=Candidatus Falkowbacteria bacterium GW2011_GWA2_39_24 TaxID=1618634 RepID=A0A0G0RNL6_9BACT|nr:MAG: hypothetical protein UT42_C0007G0003 [Candidatus Falkowbacteria bacterium GW2011_GWA2_39_24]
MAIAPSKNKTKKKSLFSVNMTIGGVSLTQKAVFAKHLSVMLRSGLNVVEALKISSTSTKGKLQTVVISVLKSVQAGHLLSSAMERHPKVFSGLFIGATYAGEASGTLDQSLENVAEQLKKEQELVSKVKGAMFYPVIILIAAFVLGLALTFLVLPKITPLFEGLGQDLPASTKALMWFSKFVEAHSAPLLIGVIALTVIFVWVIRQEFSKPIIHWLLLRIPIIRNITRGSNLSRFSLTLGTLLKTGLNIDAALEITKNTLSNHYYKRALVKINDRVNKGASLSENLRRYEGLFPPMMNRMVMVGERSGKLEETLLYLAEFYQIEVDNDTKTLSTAIEPILLLSIGVVVGFLAISIVTPIYNITGTVKQ